jgi:heme-degrading monooxygenase HmoA
MDAPMYVAMNRFSVLDGHEREFEDVWLGRDIFLNEVPGFVEFHLVRGPSEDGHTLYATHTIWASEDAFRDWTRSQAFRDAHKNAGDHKHLYAGPPKFEGFEVIQTVKPGA